MITTKFGRCAGITPPGGETMSGAKRKRASVLPAIRTARRLGLEGLDALA
jgi:hypothetical protein